MGALRLTYKENYRPLKVVRGNFYLQKNSDAERYEFGFNGQLKDNEIYGEGNAYDFGDREYDPRSVRWWKVDRLEKNYPSISPYVFAGNSILVFKDSDGEKFVNPYAEQYTKAKLELEKSNEVYTSLIKNHVGKITRTTKQEYKSQSGLTYWQNEYNKYQPNYQEVEDYLYTLYVSNPKEYGYFETLKDKYGDEIYIEIRLFNEIREGEDPGNTLNTMTRSTDGIAYIPTAEIGSDGKKTLIIALRQAQPSIDLFEYNNGRNYRTFANELGDIQYLFDNVNDKFSNDKWINSSSSNSPGYRTDKTGAGEFSREYDENRVNDVKVYSRNLGEKESYNSTKNTIEKRTPE